NYNRDGQPKPLIMELAGNFFLEEVLLVRSAWIAGNANYHGHRPSRLWTQKASVPGKVSGGRYYLLQKGPQRTRRGGQKSRRTRGKTKDLIGLVGLAPGS